MYAASGISVAVRGKLLLDRVDLGLAPGQVTVLIGPNGAGKSTLLGVMAGGRRVTAGRVTLHGRDLAVWSPPELAGMRSVLSQSVSVAFAFRVDEVVRLGLPATVARSEAHRLVADALGRVGLTGLAARDCTTLSGGEQQRVHLARALVQLAAAPGNGRARYLLLDEPTSGLDLAHQLLVVEIAREHAAAGGGVLAVLHDLNLAALAADRIVALDRGRIVADGLPAEVITDRLLAETYRVGLRVNVAPPSVFVLPSGVSVGSSLE
jgi:iron complex transport system ATP-binding protein